MKKLLFSALILSVAFFSSSCTDKTVEKEVDVVEEFSKEAFYNSVSRVPFYISEAYRVVNGDTTNVLADPLMVLYRDAVFLTFWAGAGSDAPGEVQFYGGSIITNAPFSPPARAFGSNLKFGRPTSMHFSWDDAKKTIVVTSAGTDEAFRLVPPGKSAYLDTKNFHYKYDFEAAKAGADQTMRFIFEDYTIVMKPLYIYYTDPDGASWYRGLVVF